MFESKITRAMLVAAGLIFLLTLIMVPASAINADQGGLMAQVQSGSTAITVRLDAEIGRDRSQQSCDLLCPLDDANGRPDKS